MIGIVDEQMQNSQTVRTGDIANLLDLMAPEIPACPGRVRGHREHHRPEVSFLGGLQGPIGKQGFPREVPRIGHAEPPDGEQPLDAFDHGLAEKLVGRFFERNAGRHEQAALIGAQRHPDVATLCKPPSHRDARLPRIPKSKPTVPHTHGWHAI